MVKYFCDACEEEIVQGNRCTTDTKIPCKLASRRPLPGKLALAVEVAAFVEGNPGSGLYCKYCVIDAVNKTDDRPRVAS